MMTLRQWLFEPMQIHAWRWRALTVWVICFTAVVAVLFQQHHDQTQKAERVAAETRIQNAKQQRVLVNLCNRGYVLLAVMDVLLDSLPRGYHNDLTVYRNVLVDELAGKDSPCVAITR